MVKPFFTSVAVKDFETASTCDTALFGKFFWAMAEAGLYIPPSQFETWFLPINITDAEMDVVESRIKKAFAAMA